MIFLFRWLVWNVAGSYAALIGPHSSYGSCFIFLAYQETQSGFQLIVWRRKRTTKQRQESLLRDIAMYVDWNNLLSTFTNSKNLLQNFGLTGFYKKKSASSSSKSNSKHKRWTQLLIECSFYHWPKYTWFKRGSLQIWYIVPVNYTKTIKVIHDGILIWNRTVE